MGNQTVVEARRIIRGSTAKAGKARFSDRWYSHALKDAQITEVAEKFSFSAEDIQQLSKRLAHALNPEDAPVTVTLSRERAELSAKEKVARD